MIVYCLGMQSSGSTWLYNVVREILAAAGTDHVAFRAESFDNFLDTRAADGSNAVLRAHNVDSLLLRILKLSEVRAVLSFRDPRDAIASFLQRFEQYGARFPRICNDVSRNLAALLSAGQCLENVSFFYEDGFTDKPESVRRLAAFLGYALSEDQVQTIFIKYHAETIRAFLADIDKLPDERLFVDDAQNAMDRLTSFHRTHISDMRVGKWRDLFDADTQSLLTQTFGDYARILSERATGPGPYGGWNPDILPVAPFKVLFSSRIFAPIDNMDHFTRFLACNEVSGELGIRALDYIYLPEGEWEFTVQATTLSSFRFRFCQNGTVHREEETNCGSVTFRFINQLHDHPFDVHVSYDTMEADVVAHAPPPVLLLEAVWRRSAATAVPR